VPTFTPTAYALELAKARRAAVLEAAELVSALASQSGRVQAAALLGLGDDANAEVDRLTAALDAETAAKAKPKKSRRRAAAAPAPEPLIPEPEPERAPVSDAV
jgi:hypothetical protein